MRVLYRVYSWACADEKCGTWQYECRVPGDRDVSEYRPTFCRKCGGIQMSERIKGEPKCA